jgi:hypothetical protein
MTPPYPKPQRKRTKAPAAPTRTTRHDVIARDGSICQWCGKHCDTSTGWYSLQHRRARGLGGTSRPTANTAANLVLVHGTGTTGCHGEIESQPALAAARGFRIRQDDDPSFVPIRCWNPIWGLSWHVLDDNGGKPFMTIFDAEARMTDLGIEVHP